MLNYNEILSLAESICIVEEQRVFENATFEIFTNYSVLYTTKMAWEYSTDKESIPQLRTQSQPGVFKERYNQLADYAETIFATNMLSLEIK